METGIVMLLVGLIFGLIIGVLCSRPSSIGLLRVIESDENEPYLFLNLDKPVENIKSKKFVSMKVRLEKIDSH